MEQNDDTIDFFTTIFLKTHFLWVQIFVLETSFEQFVLTDSLNLRSKAIAQKTEVYSELRRTGNVIHTYPSDYLFTTYFNMDGGYNIFIGDFTDGRSWEGRGMGEGGMFTLYQLNSTGFR